MEITAEKRNGVHYTPAPLAEFLANQIAQFFEASDAPPKILDPACGDGALLKAIHAALPNKLCPEIYGFDIDVQALEKATTALPSSAHLSHQNFLESDSNQQFDIIISNPPYVRTQVLGSKRSQALSLKYGLSGRVDLYHAFAIKISESLREGGVVGLLTSNRFLATKSGKSMRGLLQNDFEIHEVFDLGDTKLFNAAVLPAIVIAAKRARMGKRRPARFVRVYGDSIKGTLDTSCQAELLTALANRRKRTWSSGDNRFVIEQGRLVQDDPAQPWRLTNRQYERWLSKIRQNQFCNFGDLAEIKVGIKTTADSVFIRPTEEWTKLPRECRPEPELLRPLLTHHIAGRWRTNREPVKSVLYPYEMTQPNRTLVDQTKFPRAFRYLNQHRGRLESRKYLVDSGRSWFEIWVPHQPVAWAGPKLVWPDISEAPKFFLDESDAIVNGDCYWIKLKDEVDRDWLLLMLAVANSTVATELYDKLFHNKLYAKRRRFMTQYVAQFPLPSIERLACQRLIQFMKQRMTCGFQLDSEHRVEEQIRKLFGITRQKSQPAGESGFSR